LTWLDNRESVAGEEKRIAYIVLRHSYVKGLGPSGTQSREISVIEKYVFFISKLFDNLLYLKKNTPY
jgi:hypothetical protein